MGFARGHFREVKVQLQNRLPDGSNAPRSPRTRRSRRLTRAIADLAQLRFPFPAPFAAVPPLST